MHAVTPRTGTRRIASVSIASHLRAACLLGVAASLFACDDPVAPRVDPPRVHADVLSPAAPTMMVSGGGYHSCGLRLDGAIVCWGTNSFGAVTGTTPPTSAVAPFEHPGPFADVSAGYYHTCARRADGTVACWGAGATGAGSSPDFGQSMVPSELGEVLALDAGSWHSCALAASDGAVTCWGQDQLGQLSGTKRNPSPYVVLTATRAGPFSDVRSGNFHNCALATDGGTATCWGDDVHGQVSATQRGYSYATTATHQGPFTGISAGGQHSCAVREDRTVVCWGAGMANTGAFPHYGQSIVPEGLSDVVEVVAGESHTCARTADGTVVCWGAGTSSTGPQPYYGQSVVPAGLADVVDLSAGRFHTCAVRANGSVACWGLAAHGQISLPSDFSLLVPQIVTFTSTPPNPAWVGSSYEVAAVGGPSGQPVVFETLTPSVCTLSGDRTVTLVAAGTCRIVARQAGDATHQPARAVTQQFLVVRQAQTIAFASAPPSPAILGGSYAPSATGGGSGNPVVFTSLTPAVCPLEGDVLRLAAIGTCTLAADQAGNAAYLAAPRVTQTFSVVFAFGGSTGGGFASPVSSTAFNAVRAGQSVPVKFDLGGDRGSLVLASGYPQSMEVACPDGSEPVNVVPEETETAGGSTLSYDPATGLYTYVWKTDRAWTGTCREFALGLVDGTEHRARFQFAR